jgi:hypothetical protein
LVVGIIGNLDHLTFKLSGCLVSLGRGAYRNLMMMCDLLEAYTEGQLPTRQQSRRMEGRRALFGLMELGHANKRVSEFH